MAVKRAARTVKVRQQVATAAVAAAKGRWLRNGASRLLRRMR